MLYFSCYFVYSIYNCSNIDKRKIWIQITFLPFTVLSDSPSFLTLFILHGGLQAFSHRYCPFFLFSSIYLFIYLFIYFTTRVKMHAMMEILRRSLTQAFKWVNTFKFHVFAPMGRFQFELIYLYFPPSSHLIYVCFCPVGLSLL